MKLYEVPRNSWVIPVEETKAPPGARQVAVGEPVLFSHCDGMYSFCKDKNNNVVHLPAWQEVTIIKGRESVESDYSGCREYNVPER